MTKVAAVEICHTADDVTRAKALWAELEDYKLVFESKQGYLDLSLYNRNGGAGEQLTGNFGSGDSVILVFETG